MRRFGLGQPTSNWFGDENMYENMGMLKVLYCP